MASAMASSMARNGASGPSHNTNSRPNASDDDEAVEVTHVERDEELEDFDISDDDDDGVADGGAKLDHAMMNELLLVCSNLGMLRVQHEGEAPVLMRGEDCDEWIHDLQRAIRRDHAKHKLVVKQLGKWKILQKKLLPLLVNHQHDWSLVFSILKVLVMLTMKPPRDSTNIALQLTYLREYKHAFLRERVIPILMTILVEPLAKRGSVRTPQDYLNMELVLTLLRNLLAIPNEDARFLTSSTSHLSHLQQDLIRTLHEESVYEMVLLFAQDIDSAENREWNLLIMEMVDLTLGCSTPKAVAAFFKQQRTGVPSPSTSSTPGSQSAVASSSSTAPTRGSTSAAPSLVHALSTEKKLAQPRKPVASKRHSNFGGMMKLVGSTGRSSVLTSFSKLGDEQVPQAAKKPVMRKRGGRGSQPPITQTMDVIEIFAPRQSVHEGDHATMAVLVEICETVLDKSYFQLTNSLKGEFRRGSTKLVSTDRLQYFHLLWFMTTYHRLKMQTLKSEHRHKLKAHEKHTRALLEALDFETVPPAEPTKPELNEKAVLSTLDMFSFNFVLQSIETYASGKNYHGMTVSVKLLAEMMTYLSELSNSDDVRFQQIADSLQHKIFYERDFLDRLPVLLKTWTPGSFSMEYVADVITMTHIVFKILDSQGTIKVLSRRKALLDEKRKQKTKNKTKKTTTADGDTHDDDDDDAGNDDDDDEEEEAERRAQLLLEMQRKEADFDVRRYFQTILSADTIKMYCHALAHYRTNSAKLNHFIHSFFYRAKHFRIHKDEQWTMQPMLFNIHVLLLFNKMLQDPQIQKQSEFQGFLEFIRGVVRDFFTLADKNRLLFVETMLRQSYAAKSCLLLQRNYEPLDGMAKSRSEAVALGRQEKLDRISEARRQKKALDAEELDGEAEFTFSLDSTDFQSSSLVAARSSKQMRGSDDENEEAEFPGETGAATRTIAVSRPKRRAATKAAVDRAKNWTKVEDRFLKKVYMQYRHLPSVYEVISYEDMFQDRDRTAEQIERRVKYLKLHRATHDSSDEESDKEKDKEDKEDDEDGQQSDDEAEFRTDAVRTEWSSETRLPKGLETDDEGEETQPGGDAKTTTRRRRRLRRGAADGGDEEEDDESDDDPFTTRATAAPSAPSPAPALSTETEAVQAEAGDAVDDVEMAVEAEEESEASAAMGDTLVFPDTAAEPEEQEEETAIDGDGRKRRREDDEQENETEETEQAEEEEDAQRAKKIPRTDDEEEEDQTEETMDGMKLVL